MCIRLFVRGSPWLLYTNPVKSPSVYLSAERCWECREGGRKEKKKEKGRKEAGKKGREGRREQERVGPGGG